VTIHDIITSYPSSCPTAPPVLRAGHDRPRAARRGPHRHRLLQHQRDGGYFGIPPARTIIYNGVAARFADIPRDERERVAVKYGLPRPYLLFLGGEKPHKNVRNVIRAFAEARRERALPHALVLAGPMPQNRNRVEALIAALDLESRVSRPGVIPEEDLPGLFAAADAFLYPTLYEGFGLPVIEAMACGVPVLTSSTSALQEIAGGYALLVDPMDVNAIARGIAEIATNPSRRAELVELGKRRAADFSWEHAAQQTLRSMPRRCGKSGDGDGDVRRAASRVVFRLPSSVFRLRPPNWNRETADGRRRRET
jgi:glycosyltransferase involved in cell wall biosynthesis